MREFIAAVVPFLATLVVLLLGYGARQVALIVRAKGASESIAKAFEIIARAASFAVKDAEQTVVAALKDPAQQGAWTEVTAKAVKDSVTRDVRQLVPSALAELRKRGLTDEAIESLVSKAVESAVWEMHRERK